MKIDLITHSSDETINLGLEISKKIKTGDIFGFNGNLGTGKTTFIKGLLIGLGYEGDVTSPTFSLINEYDARLKVIHVDFYREPNIKRWKDIGFEEMLYQNDLVLIEWANLIPDILPEETKIFLFEHVSINKRKIKLV